MKILINLAGWFGQSNNVPQQPSTFGLWEDLPGNHRGVDSFFKRLIHLESAWRDMFDQN
ncbi:hypothetical protein [Pseudomonas sp. FEN]|uniref:hypothetical protein n=1 Tax=Pseudomonas sp. FEN TaxID=2767468 RepID=UPI00174B1A0E|nr:hypothetical protein [Pseudomonas sp. FEN]